MAKFKKVTTNGNDEDAWETVAVLKTKNVYDRDAGEFTDEIDMETLIVETFVKDLKVEKPSRIGYIRVSTLEKFLDGKVKVCPIKKRRD